MRYQTDDLGVALAQISRMQCPHLTGQPRYRRCDPPRARGDAVASAGGPFDV
jgi:hypothetical protein